MAGKGRFKIPSLEDAEDKPVTSFQAQSLFAAHRGQLKANIEAGKKKSPSKPEPTITLVENLPLTTGPLKCVPSQTLVKNSTSKSSSATLSSPATSPSKKSNSSASIIKTGNVTVANAVSKSTEKQHESMETAEPTVKRCFMYKPVTTLQGSGAGEKVTEEIKNAGLTSSPTKSGKSSILVSPRQRGNPLLTSVRSVPWEFDDIVPDYQMGRTTCALFLSLRYHQLNPNYIHERLKQLGHTYDLRVLLVQVDVKDPHHSLKELAKVSILSDCTLILAFSPEEAGRYLETYKAFEAKPPDLIMERTEGTFLSKFTDCITSVKKVNKTDAMTLLSTFGTFDSIVKASEEDLSLCPGFGPQKAQRLHSVLREPFLKPIKRKPTTTEAEATSSNTAIPAKKPS